MLYLEKIFQQEMNLHTLYSTSFVYINIQEFLNNS